MVAGTTNRFRLFNRIGKDYESKTRIAIGELGKQIFLQVPQQHHWLVRFVCLPILLFLLVLSHVVLDDLALSTYHPSEALTDDVFWLVLHAFVAMLSIYLFFHFRFSALFIAAALLPDIDWLARMVNLWPEGSAHAFFRELPLVSMHSEWLRAHLPDWRLVPFAAGIELFLLSAFLLLAKVLDRKKRLKNSA